MFSCFHSYDNRGWGIPYIGEEEKGRRGEGGRGKGRMGDPALEAVADPSRGIVREFAIRRMGDYTLFILN